MSSSSERSLSVSLERLARGPVVVETPGGDQIAVFAVDGEVFAVDNRCPHEGNPLVQGDVLGRTLVCAFHGWRFDLETGSCLAGLRPVRRYPVVLDGDRAVIELS